MMFDLFDNSTCLDIPDNNDDVRYAGEGTSVRRIGERAQESRGGFGGFEGSEKFKGLLIAYFNNVFCLRSDEPTTW
jgi:hypothetical protein